MEIIASLLSLLVLLPLARGSRDIDPKMVRRPKYPDTAYKKGVWRPWKQCKEGTAMHKAELLVGVHASNTDPNFGYKGQRSSHSDKLFMLGARLVCTGPNGERENAIFPQMKGTRFLVTISNYTVRTMPPVECTKGEFFNSVRVRGQKDQGNKDDGGAITADFGCTDGGKAKLSKVLSRYRVASAYWTRHKDTTCPPEYTITMIRMKVEDVIRKNGRLKKDAGAVTKLMIACEYGPVHLTPILQWTGYWTSESDHTEENMSDWTACNPRTFVTTIFEIYDERTGKLIGLYIMCSDANDQNVNKHQSLRTERFGLVKDCPWKTHVKSFAFLRLKPPGKKNQKQKVVVIKCVKTDEIRLGKVLATEKDGKWRMRFQELGDRDNQTMREMMTKTECPEGYALCKFRLQQKENGEVKAIQGGCCRYR